jgi:hypothetical protein
VSLFAEPDETAGVLPSIDGTWAAICPTCRDVVVNLEQSRDKVTTLLEAHQRQEHGQS